MTYPGSHCKWILDAYLSDSGPTIAKFSLYPLFWVLTNESDLPWAINHVVMDKRVLDALWAFISY